MHYSVRGTLIYARRRSLKREALPIRLVYPPDFPKKPQRVFDEEKRFKPGLKGHMFSDYGLCLSIPERDEFSVGTEELTEEIVGASLVWFHKRLIYERLKKWPGEEDHGVRPRLDLLIERAGLSGSLGIQQWIDIIVQNRVAGRQLIDPYSACPCGVSGTLKFCHWDQLRSFFRVVETIERGSEGKD